jgi:hypothetical protein
MIPPRTLAGALHPFPVNTMRISSPRRLIVAAIVFSAVAVTATAQRLFSDIGGKWSMTIDGPQGPTESAVSLTQEGEVLTGTITNDMFGTSKLEGNVKGDTVRFAFTIDAGGQSIPLTAGAFVKDKDTVSGQIIAEGMGNFPFTMTRAKTGN